MYIPKRTESLYLHKNAAKYINVQSSIIIHNSQKWKQFKCPIHEWIYKTDKQNRYIMEYNMANKKK